MVCRVCSWLVSAARTGETSSCPPFYPGTPQRYTVAGGGPGRVLCLNRVLTRGTRLDRVTAETSGVVRGKGWSPESRDEVFPASEFVSIRLGSAGHADHRHVVEVWEESSAWCDSSGGCSGAAHGIGGLRVRPRAWTHGVSGDPIRERPLAIPAARERANVVDASYSRLDVVVSSSRTSCNAKRYGPDGGTLRREPPS